MPQFRYRALNSQGHELEGTLTATDANAAVTQLSRQGLRLRSIEEGVTVARVPAYQPAVSAPVQNSVPQQRVPPAVTSKGPRYGVKPSPRATYNDRQFFFAQLGGLLRSGISPADALNTILSRSSSGKFQRQVDDMAKMCSEGMSLAEAMEHYPNMFPKGTVGAVRAGETGGYLPDACETVSQQQKETRRVFNMFAIFFIALPWCVFLLFLAGTVAMGISKAFEPLLDKGDGTFEQGVSGAVNGVLGVSFVLLFIGVLVFYFYGRSMRFRRLRHSIGLSTPMFKRRALNENLAHFSFHLSRLSKSGLSPFAAWQLAAKAVPNEIYEQRLTKISENINERSRLSELLYRSKLFPQETAQIVETGEMTGDLPHALDQVMDFGRERERQANLYIGVKAGCWTVMVFFVGGMIVLMTMALAYYRGIGQMLENM